MKFNKGYLGIVGAVLVTMSLSTLPAHAQGAPGHRGPRGGMMGDGAGMALPLLLRGANLTDDQKAQVKQIMANHRDNFRNLFSQLRTVQQDTSNKLFSTGSVQESDLASNNQQIASLRNQLAQEGLKVVLEIRGILRPDQLASVAQRYQQMQSLHNQMKSMWGTPPQGQ